MTNRTLTALPHQSPAAWDRARARAAAEGVTIYRVDDLDGWIVPSRSEPGRAHLLSLGADGAIACSCRAFADFGRVCIHAGALSLALESQR